MQKNKIKFLSDRLLRRLNGFHALRKDRHVRSAVLGLNDAEFRLFELYTDLFIWDKRYRQEYGTVSFPDEIIAVMLGWSVSKLSRTRKVLIDKDLVVKTSRGIYYIKPIFEHKTELADTEEIISKMREKFS